MNHISPQLASLAVPIAALLRDPRNARKHSERNIDAIRRSLAQFGQQKPVVLADDGRTVIAGNGTLEAAELLGWTHIAAVTSTLSGPAATAYGLADNRTGESSEWDFEQVRTLIRELNTYEFPVDALGWNTDEVDQLLKSVGNVAPATVGVGGRRAPGTASTEHPVRNPDAGQGPRELVYVPVTDDQNEIITLAVGKLREKEQDDSISVGRGLELIAADWLAGQP